MSAGAVPDRLGHFGPYGGVFVPETLMPAITELRLEYEAARHDPITHVKSLRAGFSPVANARRTRRMQSK